MKITGVYHLKDKSISKLSGGQKQRVWISMALAQGTKTLFLDEPTTYLDIKYQLQILRLIQFINKRYGTTIIMVLHDINQAITYSDEVIALSSKGKIITQGNPHEIINSETLKGIYGIDLDTITHHGKTIVLTQ